MTTFAELRQKINDFLSFVQGKLNNFKTLSRGEQVSFLAIGTGILFVLVSVVLFVI